MGLMVSKADAAAPAPLPPTQLSDAAKPPPVPNFAFAAAAAIKEAQKNEPIDFLALPAAIKYEDIQREVLMALKPELFEGMRFEINKPLNPNFFLSHSLFMGNMDINTGGRQVIKSPVGTYEFGANVIHEKYMALGRIGTDGRLSGRLKYDVNNWLALKLHCQLGSEPGNSQIMADADVKGADWNAQLKLGNPSFVGVNYFQSITPKLQAGGEFFWLQGNMKSGVGFAMRHTGDKHVATMQVATTGILSMQYAHKVNEKVTLASDFLWHWGQREATAAVGYDVVLRQCRLRGKVDTNGVVSALLEERFSPGINFVLSSELDHPHQNYKFGFGVVAGE